MEFSSTPSCGDSLDTSSGLTAMNWSYTHMWVDESVNTFIQSQGDQTFYEKMFQGLKKWTKQSSNQFFSLKKIAQCLKISPNCRIFSQPRADVMFFKYYPRKILRKNWRF
jgi:hypothetical protein